MYNSFFWSSSSPRTPLCERSGLRAGRERDGLGRGRVFLARRPALLFQPPRDGREEQPRVRVADVRLEEQARRQAGQRGGREPDDDVVHVADPVYVRVTVVVVGPENHRVGSHY